MNSKPTKQQDNVKQFKQVIDGYKMIGIQQSNPLPYIYRHFLTPLHWTTFENIVANEHFLFSPQSFRLYLIVIHSFIY